MRWDEKSKNEAEIGLNSCKSCKCNVLTKISLDWHMGEKMLGKAFVIPENLSVSFKPGLDFTNDRTANLIIF